jgi:hypothetical protein
MCLKKLAVFILWGIVAAGCGEGRVGGETDAGVDSGMDAGGDDGGQPGDDGGMASDDGAAEDADASDDAGVDAGDPGTDGSDGADQIPTYGAEFFVSLSGHDDNPGTIDEPFATPERARTAIRELKAASGLPEDGVVVWLRGGVYERTATFELTSEDSGEAHKPVVYRGYPGEEVRLVGAKKLEASWFSLVDDTSPVWDRVDPLARGSLRQADLSTHGISDYGTLLRRGFYADQPAALELFFNAEPMPLGRWPDPDENDEPSTHQDDVITLFGDPVPDVTGTYVKNGTQDGVNAYARQGLVGGRQYNLYRLTWDYQSTTYTAWFISTQTSGYPGDADPWWHHYDQELGRFNPGTGAAGNPTVHDPDRINHGFASIDAALSDTAFTYRGTRPQRWSGAEAVWFHGYWKYMWADLHVPAASIDTGSKTVTFSDVPGYGIESGQPYYAENLLEEITQPGEWYLNRDTGILYFWPPGDLAAGEVYASVMEQELLRLNGTSQVIFQDITFEMTRVNLVEIDGGSDNTLLRCVLRNAGGNGAAVSGANNGLERCEIRQTGDRGVSLSGGSRASLEEAHNFVSNCHIHHFGRWSWTYKPAVGLSGAGHDVLHNRMHSAPHSAILYSGNEHNIEFNDIHDVCQFSADAGAVYSGRDWGYRGNQIRYNFIHHIDTWFEGYGVHGVYLDDCLSGIHVFGNVFYRISGHAIQHGGGRDDIMENNIMARCGDALAADNRGISAVNNIPGDSWNLLERLTRDGILYQQDPWASAYPRLAAIPNDWAAVSDPGALWLYPQGCVFSRNLGYANTQWIRESSYGGTGTLNKYDEIAGNVEDQDPLFEDEDNLDLSLQPGSPAFDIPGFVDIPFGQIGILPP